MPLLLQLLRGETLAVAPSLDEWRQTLQLAEQESVLPSAAAAICRSSVPLPEHVSTRLDAIKRDTAIGTFWWTSELSGLLAAFHQNGIPVILLKGPLLAQRIYGDINLRTSRDLDLLLRANDLRAGGALLADLGFGCVSRPDDYHESWRRGSTLVELHHNVENPLAYRVPMHGLWKRAAEIDFCGHRVVQLSPQDELLFLCLHGVRHRFERLSHVFDLALAFEHLAPQIAPNAFRSDLSAELRPLMMLGHLRAKKLRPHVSDLPIEASRAEAVHLAAVAARRWQALQQAPAAPLDWRAQHQFYLELESTLRGRLLRSVKHAVILATRLIQADFDFAARYRITQPALVWMIRQMRLIGKGATPVRQHPG
jgi:hypothetical protein